MTLDDWLARDAADVKILLVEPAALGAEAPAGPAGAKAAAEYAELHRKPPGSATIVVGPEGGWTADEIRRAGAAGYRPLTLGRRTLRADAVPIVAISVLQYLWGDL
jgi:RsmE family RNA methyltransferase